MNPAEWIENAVLYEVYIRSFCDSDGDGVGDIQGVATKLPYLRSLGVDALWLTPIFKSPQFDFGYDVSNYFAVHHEYGSLSDVQTLITEAHRFGIKVFMDIILSHTSIEHDWFKSQPDYYIMTETVPNNWLSVFGGSAWQWSDIHNAYYYHRYYPEQPNLNWNNIQVRQSMHDVINFWVDQGIDGFRLDSLDGLAVDASLRNEPTAATFPREGRENDTWADYWHLDHIYTSNLPQVVRELGLLTEKFDSTIFIVEADLPTEQLRPYMATGASAFAFDFLRAPLDGRALGRIVEGAGGKDRLTWALSNHDQPRLVSRWGRDLAGVAATLLLTLPGISCIYQGDEIGMVDGPGGPVIFDRSGRDAVRHPMQWTAQGGFTGGEPWLPMNDPETVNVADQIGIPSSMLETYRALISLRQNMRGEVEVLRAEETRLAYKRGSHFINLNLGNRPVDLVGEGAILFSTGKETEAGKLGPLSAAVVTSQS